MYGAGAALSRLFLPGARADPRRSEPESAPGPWPPGAGAGAAQKSGGSATLVTGPYSFPACAPCVVEQAPGIFNLEPAPAPGKRLLVKENTNLNFFKTDYKLSTIRSNTCNCTSTYRYRF